MSYRKILSHLLAGDRRGAFPLTTEEIRKIQPGLSAWQRRLRLPRLSEEQVRRLARRQSPALRRVMLLCMDVLRRRPAIAARVGLTHEALYELCRGQVASEAVAALARQIAQALRDGRLLLGEQLAGQQERILTALAETAADPQAPAPERHGARAGLTQLNAQKERQAQRQRERQLRRAQKRAALQGALDAANATRSAVARATAQIQPTRRRSAP